MRGSLLVGFLAAGAVEPWLPASHDQNATVTESAAATRQMHEAFRDASIPRRHVLTSPPDEVDAVAKVIHEGREEDRLTFSW